MDTMIEPTTAVETVVVTPCDACHAARAIVTVSKESATLSFCGHHHDRNFLAMVEQGWSVVE